MFGAYGHTGRFVVAALQLRRWKAILSSRDTAQLWSRQRQKLGPNNQPVSKSRNFRPIATQAHTAPPTSMIFAGVVEIKYALGIFTLADSCVVRPGKEIGGIVRYND